MPRLPRPLYAAKPFLFLLTALFLMFITNNVIVTLFAIYLICYSLWILLTRLIWKDTRIDGFIE
jgi:hypothetical protein